MNASLSPAEQALGSASPMVRTDEHVKSVLFVCTGNTCRSPMAAAALNHYGAKHGIVANSAGLFPAPGAVISKNAIEALAVKGIKPSPDNRFDLHTASRVTEAMVASCDAAVGITRQHTMTLICGFPSFADKILSMPCDIADPFGGSVEDYVRCLEQILSGIKELFSLDF